MINGKTVLAVITARGGSKGIPRKNIRNVAGKPLIAWTIEEARKSRYMDRLILSSEDREIMDVAEKWGCEVPFARPMELALDSTPGVEPVLHAIKTLPEKYDYVVLLQPTSPLRKAEDIDGCIELCVSRSAKSCVSVTEPDKSPYWMYKLDAKGRLQSLMITGEIFNRRQDLPKVYAINGAIYIAECEWLIQKRSFVVEGETVTYEIPKERSLDIDTELDVSLFQLLITNLNKRRLER